MENEMSLSQISIQRPVLAIVLSIGVVLFGAIGFLFLGVREYPSVDPPIVTVTTSYKGANAEVIISQITEPLEDVINGIAGVRSISSTSSDGLSTIKVEFNLEIDLEAGANDVRDKVAQAVRRLPPDADPFIILFTVPLALAGALFALWYFNQTLNIFSQIGMIMLIGLVTKNGILIVEFANQRKAHGLSKTEAVEDAATQRFRPILMTSLSTILGFLPIALALGAGSESRVSMGVAIVFGMLFSSLLTLYVVPAIYSFVSTEECPIKIEAAQKLELATDK